MHQFQSDTRPIALKEHTCQECGCAIPKGTKHYLQKGVFDGSWYSWRVHSDCAELYWRANKEFSRSWVDEYMPLSEFSISEIDHLRGIFPHAICRLELRRELSERDWKQRNAECCN